jgi:hypothetical protein
MPVFSVDAVEALEYDFTGFPSNKGKGYCKGKGVTPEPTDALLKGYQSGVRELLGLDEDADAGKVAKKIEKDPEAMSAQLLALTAELCQDQPSQEELAELPPRVLRAFMKATFKEIADPEV